MTEAGSRGWVLYDGSCGFCSKWVPFGSGVLARRGYGIAPLQSEWVRERVELDENELAADFRLLLPDGGLLVGAAVYRHLMRRIWWTWPLWVLSVVPGLSHLFDAGYRSFARHRHRISRACGLGGGSE